MKKKTNNDDNNNNKIITTAKTITVLFNFKNMYIIYRNI